MLVTVLVVMGVLVVGVGVGVLFKKKYKFENMKWLGLSWDVTAKNLET